MWLRETETNMEPLVDSMAYLMILLVLGVVFLASLTLVVYLSRLPFGQAYQLAGQSSLSERYTRAAENLITKIMNPEEKENSNKKQHIKAIIIGEIKKHKSNLVKVKGYIEEKFHKPLGSIDDAYIEQKYMKYCSKFWLQEITDFLKRATESNSCILIQEIFSSLDNIESLSNIPNLFKQLEYYKLLIEHYKLVSKENEKILIRRFKKESLAQIVAYSDSAEKELVNLEAFVNFLSSSKNLQSIIAELELKDFCHGKLSFNELLERIVKLKVSDYGKNLTVLQEATKCLQQERDIFLIDKFKEVVSSYIKPIEIKERKIDGRLVIEITGKNVVVSEILCRLENKLLENSNVEEVRFVGADNIHIDTNLESEVWQGRNVVILAKAIKVHDQVTWNISGKDNNHTYSNNAGTGEDGHGKQGKDGYPGESGGNVLILVENIENPEKFTIVSNGGKGSKGQDGGNGRDGDDGKGITKAEFGEKFPPAANFSHKDRAYSILKTVNNIKKDLQVIRTQWYESKRPAIILKRDVIINENVIEEVIKDCNNTIRYHGKMYRTTTEKWPFEGNIFINAMTTQGNEITFSFERGGYTTNCQAFLLYKGSSGQPGGHGGEYGLGGQGGYPGEITVKHLESSRELNIIRNTKQGKGGEKGQGGLYGSHGKNGCDMGYIDYSVTMLEKYPKFFGTDQSSKLSLEFSTVNSSKHVCCPYKERKDTTDIYAGIIASTIEHKKQKKYEERENTRQNSERQRHAQAARKKNISQNSILASYSHHLSSIEKSTLQNLRSNLETTKQLALQAISENQEQQEKQTVELGIKCHINFTCQKKYEHSNDFICDTTFRETARENTGVLLDKLKCAPQSLDNWFQLRGIQLNCPELNEVFSEFEILKKKSLEEQDQQSGIENKLKDIEPFLIDKYRLATLQGIAKQLPPYQEVPDNIELTPESAVRYLVEETEKSNISHPSLGTLNQYLYENSQEKREKISTFCGEELQNTNNEAFKCSMRAFILEVEKSEEAHTGIKRYCDEYKEFLEKQEHSSNIFLEAFESELTQPRHAEVLDLWIESIKDKSLRSQLEEKIQNDNFLNALYNRFNNQLELDYEWDKCCKDQIILKEYNDYIREKGPLSESYRELLAYVFDINIRLYAEDQDNGLFLQDNHNPLSKKAIHVLCRANELIQLNINENYLRLEEERKRKDGLYAKILVKIETLKQKQEFGDYLKNKAFLTDNTLSEDKQYFDEENLKKIIEYFTGEEKQQLKARLEKITFQYICQQGILHFVLKRFSSEGKHVSYQELCYLINSILTSRIEDRKEQNTFCWIVAAHSQRNWIDELILLQLENRFKRQLREKSKWREYLSKIENKFVLLLFGVTLDQGGSISTQCIEDILHQLSNIPNETVSLEGLELSEWPYVLKEKYWSCKLFPLTNWQESEKLPSASYYLLSIENNFGTDLVEKLLEALEEKKQELTPDVLTNILSNFHNEKWNLSKEELSTLNSCNIDKWEQEMQQKFTVNKEERKITQLVELIKGNANTSKEILNNLPRIKSYIEGIDKNVIAGKSVGSFTENDIKNWVKEFHSSIINKGKQDIEKKMLAVIDRAIELKRGFKLYDTQRLTVLALLTNDHNTLAQVSTGEGKSLIVVAASIMKALCGEKLDIITSSSVLAKRDAEGNGDIYSLFNVNVSHNCSEDIAKRKEAYSGSQVVYGDLSNFQRDYLLDTFYGKNILGDRNFENVIIDEVDSVLLDKGTNMVYLSHDLAGLDKLESVYIYIWQWINRVARDPKEMCYAFDIKAIKEAVVSDLYGLVKKEDIGKLGPELSEQHKSIIWEHLVKAEILDNQGKLLKENIDDNKLNEILLPKFFSYKDRLNYLLKECIERENFIHVPNHLRSFVEKHLESWINSAITAFFMKAGQDYVVDVDRAGTSPDRNPNITILDRDRGTDQANSQWDEALHQFLQLKHGCKVSLQSLKAVFISNVSFFKLYSNLYGLTGTLGSQRERDLLREINKVDFVTIPTTKSKQFDEDKPILCTGKEEWINHICNAVKKLTEEKKRSVLIICETVNDVEVLHKAFGEKNAKHVHTYIRDYEEFDIAQGNKKLDQGQIIIATNLAGRGTDIKITEGLRKAGGLHVCLTYLPSNIRIEQQAFGRAARSGVKGSGQLIIMDSKGQEYTNSRILDLKKERDVEEIYRISDIKTYYETRITMEESCFKAFKEQYEQLKKKLDYKSVHTDDKSIPTEVKEILLQSCLDKWAFWLDENSKCIKNVTDEQSKRNFNSLLDKFILQLKNLDTGYTVVGKRLLENYGYSPNTYVPIIEYDSKSWLAWVEGNPVQMVKLGRYLSQNERHINAHGNAIKLFDEVIKKEPSFSEAAHYYKAFALAKEIDWQQRPLGEGNKQILKEFKKELRKAARLLDEHSKFAINAAGIIGKIKKNNNQSIIQINAYEEQKKSVANLYYMFSQSIDDIFGHTITPQSFVNYDIKEELAENLYKDLLEKGMLERPRVKKNISKERLKTISSGYGVLVETLKSFLSGYRDINENKFLKALKEAVSLPNREAFWKLLIQEGVLCKEVKYVVVDNERLREIDPSLSDFLNEELTKQTLELNNKQIILYVEWITQQQNNGNIFKKDDFIKIVGKDKYKILKEKRVLSFNKKADIDPSKIESRVLSCYDSITIEDFTNKANITKSEAAKILAELIERKVLEKKDDSENIAYGLKIKFDEMEQVQLHSCPVYENVVRGLLSVCFTYRIVLQRIVKQLEEKNFPIRLQLMTKPHQSLVLELLEQKIIRPTMVITEDEDLEEKLKNIYSLTTGSKDEFKRMLSQDKLIPEECTEKLFNFLIEKKWIVSLIDTQCPIQPILETGIRVISKENIVYAISSVLLDRYYINSPDKRQIPLNFSPEGSHENVLTKSQSIDKTVEKLLDNRLQLAKEDTIKNIVSTLKRSRSSLKALKVPDSKLKSLTEFYGQTEFANIEEVHVFFLNGLDQLLQLEEMKWTHTMLYNTLIVTAMGLSQIAIGTAIELYSVGVMTHVGAAFINEGVNDLLFAVGALKSGYFSWEDYRQHKLESLMVTAATCGIGAYLSRGAKVSRFGYKLAGPGIEVGGKKVAEMSVTQIVANKIADWNWKVVGKEAAKRIVLKAAEGVAFGLANAGVDTIVENHFQALCESIASNILSNIEQAVERHNISISLKKAYETLGEKCARKMVNDLTKSAFTKQYCVEKFLRIANKIASSITQGITEAVKKRSKTSNKLDLPIYAIGKLVVWSERSAQIANITMITNNILSNIDQEIKGRLNKPEKDVQRGPLSRKQETEKDYENFKNEVIDQWKSLLREKAGQIISRHIVSPILKAGANSLLSCVGKILQETYESYKESGYLEDFEKLKQEYKEKLQSEQQCDNTSKIKNHITEKYHKDLLKLMIKTRNVDLVADIVRENIPMDMTCVSACIPVVHKLLNERGVDISGLTVIVEGDGGVRQEFSSMSEGAESIIITLKVKDNHFQLCGSNASESNRDGESKNICLYEAFAEAIPQIRDVKPEEFRAGIANCIERDPKIRYYIQQRWHRVPTSLGVFGGNLERADVLHDMESSSFDNEIHGDYEGYLHREREVPKHFQARFERYLRFGGITQRISEQTNIGRGEVVRPGASRYKDQSSRRGRNIHAAHVVRAGKINPKLEKQYKQLSKELKEFLGHTQNVPKYANEWHGVGGDVDKFQAKNLRKLGTINFGGSLTAENASTIKELWEDFIAVLDNRIDGGKLGDKEKSELIEAKTALTNSTINSFFEKGKVGYRRV